MDPATSSPSSLSKNAQKRLAKAARAAEHKKERRAAEKQRRKENKRRLAQQRAEAGGDREVESRKKPRLDEHAGPPRPFGARVVVDLGFDDMMSDNEVKSLTSQLAFTYSANRKAIHPFASILFTSLNGRTLTRLEAINDAAYKRWVNAEWWHDSYEKLWENAEGPSGQSDADAGAVAHTPVQDTSTPTHQVAPKDKAVYLTADAADELMELREDETYIIGGLCDHNRYKNLCQGKANAGGLRSARLPIGTYLASLRTRKVLTVNQTFEILLRWVESRDWERALWAVIPKRKFQDKGKATGGNVGAQDANASEDEDGDADEETAEETQVVVVDVQELEEAGGEVIYNHDAEPDGAPRDAGDER